jgi:hypothetical protein
MKRARVLPSASKRPAAAADACVAADHPLRAIKARADAVLLAFARDLDALHAQPEPWPVSPARLLKAQLLIALYGIDPDDFREALRADPAFPWFLDMRPTEEADWSDPAQQRERLADSIVARWFFSAVFASARSDGTLDAGEFAVESELLRALGSLERVRHWSDQPMH